MSFDFAENHSVPSAQVSVTTASSSSDVTSPSVPTNLNSTAQTVTTIQLNWDASTDTGGSGMSSYRVYRAGTLIASPTANSYSDTGLTANTSYSYAVKAVDNAGNFSGSSATLTISTQRTLVFKDNFGRADGDTYLSLCRTPSGYVCWNGNSPWTTLAHHATYPIPGTASWTYAQGNSGPPWGTLNDFKATVTITNNPNGAGVYFWDNYPNSGTGWYIAYLVGTTLKLSYLLPPVSETVLATATVGSSLGTISVEAVASTRLIKVSYNGTSPITYTETDMTRGNTGHVGMAQYNTPSAASTVLLDNFILQN